MQTASRPIAPHLRIYRWQITMTMSILHRLTGIWLALGTLALVYWLVALAAGPDAYGAAQALFGSGLGQFLMWTWTFCLFYHLCNGIRHLCWDAGWGFEIRTLYISGYGVWAAAGVLTAAAIVLAYVQGGSA